MTTGNVAGYVQLFGAARIRVGLKWLPFVPDKRYKLLAYLAYQGDWVSREKLAYLFWPDTTTLVFYQFTPPPSIPSCVPEGLEDFCGSFLVRSPGEQAR